MKKLLIADIKMLFRNRQAIFWSLMFPLMFTFIFGFFFGGDNASIGTVALINNSQTELAKNFETTIKDANFIKTRDDKNLEEYKKLLRNSSIAAIIEIPEKFGQIPPKSEQKIKIIYDPANTQSSGAIINFVNGYLTQINYQSQNVQPIYSIEEEKTSADSLNYFDFVLIGLIGMALMNSSVQAIAINMSKYREDKILKRIVTTPLKTWKFIASKIVAYLVLNILQISLILFIGTTFFNAHIYGNIFIIYILGIIGAILFQSIGFVIASLAKTTNAAEGMSVAITIPMMFLAGVFFPIDQLPKWLFSIVQYLPLAPLLRMIRAVGLENASPLENPINIIIVTSWILIMLIIATLNFKLTEE